ncbi:MAG: hypothetical protein M4579_007396 [Chaenotheca gracillima]|nr:MAG: hypothetical protein M4579_007396 [Chaenotheca gracillima]
MDCFDEVSPAPTSMELSVGGWWNRAEHARRDAEYVALLRGQQRQPQHRQIPARSGPSGPSKQAPPPPYVPNLLVQLSNIHPSATKPTIHSFVARHVDRYSRKSAGKGKSSEGGSKRDSSQGVKVDYVDHVANTTMAIVRLGCEADARRVVDAFDGKGRGMGAGDDGRGVRVHGEGGDGVIAVKAELLGGEKERIYWDGIRSKMRKKKGVRGEKGSTVNMTGSGNGRHIRFT